MARANFAPSRYALNPHNAKHLLEVWSQVCCKDLLMHCDPAEGR